MSQAKLGPDEWQGEAGGKKVTVRGNTDWVSYRVAKRDIEPQVTKKLSLKPGTKLELKAPNGSVYFVKATKP